MATFYFTYGSDERFPYQGGWTEVEAPTLKEACDLFRLVHPRRDPTVPIGNYSDVYTEEEFRETGMPLEGNRGACCHERIALNVEVPGSQRNTSPGNRKAEPPEMPLLEAVRDTSASVLESGLAMSGNILLDSGIEDVARKLGLPVETEPDEDENGPFAFNVIRLGGVEALQIDDEYIPEDGV